MCCTLCQISCGSPGFRKTRGLRMLDSVGCPCSSRCCVFRARRGVTSSRSTRISRAVDLAEKHNFPQMEALLVRHTGQLLQKGDPLQAVEVFRMAGKATDAALLLAKLAEDAGTCCSSSTRPPSEPQSWQFISFERQSNSPPCLFVGFIRRVMSVGRTSRITQRGD